MDKGWLLTIALVMAMVFCTDAMGQQKKTKSTKKLTKQYVDYVKNKDKKKKQLAQKKSSDAATVTREKMDSTEQPKPKTFQDAYNEFRQQARSDYENFREKANREYAEFVRKAWEEYQVMPAISKPKKDEVPPVVMPEEDRQKPVEDKPVPVKEDVVTLPEPEPQPVPIAPIKEQPKPVEKYVSFAAYGTTFKVRFNDEQRFSLSSCSNEAIADAWELMSGADYNNTIRDCLEFSLKNS